MNKVTKQKPKETNQEKISNMQHTIPWGLILDICDLKYGMLFFGSQQKSFIFSKCFVVYMNVQSEISKTLYRGGLLEANSPTRKAKISHIVYWQM